MSKMLKWFFMLSKRLYKKASFIVLLLLIPISILAFSLVAKQNNGFYHVVLAQMDSEDEISSRIINELLSGNSLIRFSVADSGEEAIESALDGLADEAWIFAEDTKEIIDDFPNRKHAVSIYVKEQSIPGRLSREKLAGVMFKYCAKAYYIEYIRSHFSYMNTFSDEYLEVYFDNASVDDTLFNYENSSNGQNSGVNTNYLITPIRGLLAIFAVLCGLAATMYYKQDEMLGTFSLVKNKRKGIVAFGCIITAIINISVVLFLSMLASSLTTNVFKELVILLIYSLCSASFCLLLNSVFDNLKIFAVLIPLLTVLFIGACPVFLDFRMLYWLQMLLPPTYYVNSLYDGRYLLYMILYSIVCIILSLIFKSIKRLIKMIAK